MSGCLPDSLENLGPPPELLLADPALGGVAQDHFDVADRAIVCSERDDAELDRDGPSVRVVGEQPRGLHGAVTGRAIAGRSPSLRRWRSRREMSVSSVEPTISPGL